MIKATEAKAMSRSAVLDQHILDQINFAIIKETSKGNRRANITLIHKEMKPEKLILIIFIVQDLKHLIQVMKILDFT